MEVSGFRSDDLVLSTGREEMAGSTGSRVCPSYLEFIIKSNLDLQNTQNDSPCIPYVGIKACSFGCCRGQEVPTVGLSMTCKCCLPSSNSEMPPVGVHKVSGAPQNHKYLTQPRFRNPPELGPDNIAYLSHTSDILRNDVAIVRRLYYSALNSSRSQSHALAD